MDSNEAKMRDLGYGKLIDLLIKGHEGQTRIQGTPYYLHPVACMAIGYDWLMDAMKTDTDILNRWGKENSCVWQNDVAMQDFIHFLGGHDLFEDSTIERRLFSFDFGILPTTWIDFVTKPPKSGMVTSDMRSYNAYTRIGGAPEVVKWGKLVDRFHNLSEMRLASRQFRFRQIMDTQMLLSLINIPLDAYPMQKVIPSHLEQCRAFFGEHYGQE
jgi:(p)ppGpp synthase/HD superfamily hydrolase